MKSKATGCGSISNVFFTIVLLCVSIIITRIITIILLIIIIIIIVISQNVRATDDHFKEVDYTKKCIVKFSYLI